MKIIIAIIVILALGWFVYSTMSPAEEATPTETETSEEAVEEGTEGSVEENSASAEDGMDSMTEEETTGDAKAFDLTGQNFEFSLAEIRVKEGDTVTINFSSTGGLHDIVIDGLDVATDRVQEGETTSVTFVADEAGEFEYYCSVGTHRAMGMVGTLVVEPADAMMEE